MALAAAASFSVEEALPHLYPDCLDDVFLAHGESWLEDSSLLSSLSAGGEWLALARGSRLWLCERGGAGKAVAAGRARAEATEHVTALCFAAFSRARGSPPDTALLVGTSAGRLRVLTPGGGEVVSQRLHETAVVSLSSRTVGEGSCCDDVSEDVCVAFPDAVGRLDPLELASQLRRFALQRPGEEWVPEPLSLVKWNLSRAGAVSIAVGLLAGPLPLTLSDELLAAGGDARPCSTCILSAGEEPAFGQWAGSEAQRGVLGAAVALAATAVTAVGTAMLNLLSPWGRTGSGSAAAARKQPRRSASGASVASEEEEEEPPAALPGAAGALMHDPPRRGRALALSPRRGLLAGADTLGRVLLFELRAGHLMQARRLWKGYRDAQLAWVELAGGEQALAIHCARRGGLLEVWRVSGESPAFRLRCGRNCRLFAPSPPFGGAAAAAARGAFVLDGEGELRQLEFPSAAPS